MSCVSVSHTPEGHSSSLQFRWTCKLFSFVDQNSGSPLELKMTNKATEGEQEHDFLISDLLLTMLRNWRPLRVGVGSPFDGESFQSAKTTFCSANVYNDAWLFVLSQKDANSSELGSGTVKNPHMIFNVCQRKIWQRVLFFALYLNAGFILQAA